MYSCFPAILFSLEKLKFIIMLSTNNWTHHIFPVDFIISFRVYLILLLSILLSITSLFYIINCILYCIELSFFITLLLYAFIVLFYSIILSKNWLNYLLLFLWNYFKYILKIIYLLLYLTKFFNLIS